MMSDRLGEYIAFKNLSFYLFENSINASRGSISKAVKNNKSIGSNVIENILNTYTDLNPTWLLTGRGEMILSNKKTGDIEDNFNLNQIEKIEIIEYISANIDEFNSYKSFIQLKKVLFADDEMGEVKKEIEKLKNQVSKLAKTS